MESEWIDGLKVFLHVHGINLYRIYTLSPKQLVAEILHHLESRKPYKLWDKLHINWFAAFVFRWKSPFPPRAAYRISTQRSKAWASRGGQRSGPWIQVCFWLILMKWWIFNKISGPTWRPCRLQDVFKSFSQLASLRRYLWPPGYGIFTVLSHLHCTSWNRTNGIWLERCIPLGGYDHARVTQNFSKVDQNANGSFQNHWLITVSPAGK